MKRIHKSVLGGAIFGFAALAYAATPAEFISARQSNYKQIAKAAKAIQDELKKPAPTIATLQSNAGAIDFLAKRVKRWYPKGTGAESGVKTQAAPAIWTDRAGFNKAADYFANAAAALKAAAKSGDIEKVRAAAGPLGLSCKGCHDGYRIKG